MKLNSKERSSEPSRSSTDSEYDWLWDVVKLWIFNEQMLEACSCLYLLHSIQSPILSGSQLWSIQLASSVTLPTGQGRGYENIRLDFPRKNSFLQRKTIKALKLTTLSIFFLSLTATSSLTKHKTCWADTRTHITIVLSDMRLRLSYAREARKEREKHEINNIHSEP